MPGIVGIIDKGSSREDNKALKAMLTSMVKEDFYTSGLHVDDTSGIRIGWTCHKNSFSDCLPIWNEKKNICLIFVGEDAREESDLAGLRAAGHQCRTDRADYLVHLYEDEGIGFLEKINGGFSGILLDLRQDRAYLFNDRFGLNRLYYHEDEKAFYFASEAKSLLRTLPHLGGLDHSGLAEFFSRGYVQGNKTLFSGVSLVPAGSLWEFSPGGRIERGAHFRREDWKKEPALSKEVFYAKLKETWARILPRYFPRRERVSVSLTGDVSSRMIMAWAPCPPYRVPCYTFSGSDRDDAEVEIARKEARLCQQHHETITIKRNFFAEFPALAKRAVLYTDGTMGVWGAADLYINKLARGICPITVKGDLGDLVLQRIAGLETPRLSERIFDGEFYRRLHGDLSTCEKIGNEPALSFLAFHKIPWQYYPRMALENTQLTVRLPFLDNDLFGLAYQVPSESAMSGKLSHRLISDGFPAMRRLPIAQRMFPELGSRARFEYDHRMPRWLRRLGHKSPTLHVQKIFLGRQECHGFRTWYRGALAKYVQDILLDDRTFSRPYLDRTGIESIIKEHLAGHGDYTDEIHALLTSELIQRHLINS
jgi:asparagine synthase (glutamine-hydrolysing)